MTGMHGQEIEKLSAQKLKSAFKQVGLEVGACHTILNVNLLMESKKSLNQYYLFRSSLGLKKTNTELAYLNVH